MQYMHIYTILYMHTIIYRLYIHIDAYTYIYIYNIYVCIYIYIYVQLIAGKTNKLI